MWGDVLRLTSLSSSWHVSRSGGFGRKCFTGLLKGPTHDEILLPLYVGQSCFGPNFILPRGPSVKQVPNLFSLRSSRPCLSPLRGCVLGNLGLFAQPWVMMSPQNWGDPRGSQEDSERVAALGPEAPALMESREGFPSTSSLAFHRSSQAHMARAPPVSSRNTPTVPYNPSLGSGRCMTNHLGVWMTWNPYSFPALANGPVVVCMAVLAANCQCQCSLRLFSWIQGEKARV